MRPSNAAPNKAPVAKETRCGRADSRCLEGSARKRPAARTESTPETRVERVIQKRVVKGGDASTANADEFSQA